MARRGCSLSPINDNENNYEATSLQQTNSVTHQHPVGPGELGIAEDVARLVLDVAEDLMHSLRGHRGPLIIAMLIMP